MSPIARKLRSTSRTKGTRTWLRLSRQLSRITRREAAGIGSITIVGLGPDGLRSISQSAFDALRSANELYLRTIKHPAADELQVLGLKFASFDDIYETSGTFDEVYTTIADRLLTRTKEGTDVVYAVPGHPLVGERSVELVVQKAASLGVKVKIEGSMSFIESCLEALAVSISRGLKVLDALEIDRLEPDPELPNLIYQVYSRDIASAVKLRLMEFYPDEFEISVVTGGLDGSFVENVPLHMLDRREFDHLASVFVPER